MKKCTLNTVAPGTLISYRERHAIVLEHLPQGVFVQLVEPIEDRAFGKTNDWRESDLRPPSDRDNKSGGLFLPPPVFTPISVLARFYPAVRVGFVFVYDPVAGNFLCGLKTAPRGHLPDCYGAFAVHNCIFSQ